MKRNLSITIFFLLLATSAHAVEIKQLPEIPDSITISSAPQGESILGKIWRCKLSWSCYRSPRLGATITTINATDLISASRATINDNFAALNLSKLENASSTASLTITDLIVTNATATRATTTSLYVSGLSTFTGFISSASSTFSSGVTNFTGGFITNASSTLNGGTINNATIGATTQASGKFTTLSVSGLFSPYGNITATSTLDFGDATLEFPNAASSTITTTGQGYIDTTSGQFKYFDGNKIQVHRATSTISFTLASSTLNAYGGLGTTSTSTIRRTGPEQSIEITRVTCRSDHYSQNVQNAHTRIGDGTDFTTLSFCSENGNSVYPTSNNVFTADEMMQIQIGSATGTVPDTLFMRIDYKYLGD